MITLTPERALIFRITHIDNIQWTLTHGLHCRSSITRDPHYREIGNPDLIERRAHRRVPIPPGGTLSDYVPFYFTPHSPMLLNIKTGYNGVRQTPMSEIVMLVASLRTLARDGISFVYTDRHAYLQASSFTSDLDRLDELDWQILQARDFQRDPDDPGKFERYQAEALVHQHLPIASVTAIICRDAAQKTKVDDLVSREDLMTRVIAKPECYF